MKDHSFRELVVWQKAVTLTEHIYKLTDQLPSHERFGLVSQMQRAAVSIPSNIAEGCQRNKSGEFRQFCGIAYGSSAELETQLILARRIYSIESPAIDDLLDQVQRMLRQLVKKLH